VQSADLKIILYTIFDLGALQKHGPGEMRRMKVVGKSQLSLPLPPNSSEMRVFITTYLPHGTLHKEVQACLKKALKSSD
jgi:hypothetical protein